MNIRKAVTKGLLATAISGALAVVPMAAVDRHRAAPTRVNWDAIAAVRVGRQLVHQHRQRPLRRPSVQAGDLGLERRRRQPGDGASCRADPRRRERAAHPGNQGVAQVRPPGAAPAVWNNTGMPVARRPRRRGAARCPPAGSSDSSTRARYARHCSTRWATWAHSVWCSGGPGRVACCRSVAVGRTWKALALLFPCAQTCSCQAALGCGGIYGQCSRGVADFPRCSLPGLREPGGRRPAWVNNRPPLRCVGHRGSGLVRATVALLLFLIVVGGADRIRWLVHRRVGDSAPGDRPGAGHRSAIVVARIVLCPGSPGTGTPLLRPRAIGSWGAVGWRGRAAPIARDLPGSAVGAIGHVRPPGGKQSW